MIICVPVVFLKRRMYCMYRLDTRIYTYPSYQLRVLYIHLVNIIHSNYMNTLYLYNVFYMQD